MIKTSPVCEIALIPENKNSELIQNDEKLISVQLFTRHGHRTPVHLIPGIEQVFSSNIYKK